jgi:DSF synthase
MHNISDINKFRSSYKKQQYQHIEMEFDKEFGAIWGYMKPQPLQNCNSEFLQEIKRHDADLINNGGSIYFDEQRHKVNYYVCASKFPGVFNLGGDLSYIQQMIAVRDFASLRNYGALCLDNIYERVNGYQSNNILTMSLVEGDAIGGGFEIALSSQLVFADKNVSLGFPEILFNLFPAMGALPLMIRRVGVHKAEKILLSGKVYKAHELYELGLVDVVFESGHGEHTVNRWIKSNHPRHTALSSIYSSRQINHPITRDQLDVAVDLWVEAAKKIGDKEVAMMSRILKSQKQRLVSSQPNGNEVLTNKTA